MGESWVGDIRIKSVTLAEPVELECKVDRAADGGGAEHCLENVSLRITDGHLVWITNMIF